MAHPDPKQKRTQRSTATEPSEQTDQSTCPECGGSIQKDSTGALVERSCTECGLITGTDDLDRGPEWRHFGDDAEDGGSTKFIRCGAPNNRAHHDKGLGSQIGYRSEINNRRLSRLRKWHGRSRFESKKDRNRAEAFGEIATLVSRLEAGRPLLERACYLFQRAQEQGVYGPGNTRELYVGGVVYATCREFERATLPSDIAAHLPIEDEDIDGSTLPNTIRHRYSTLCRELGLTPRPLTASDYVPQIVDELGLPRYMNRQARDITAEASDQQWTVGRDPRGIAGAAVYILAKRQLEFHEQPRWDDLSDLLDVSNVTLRGARDELLDTCGETIDEVTSGPTAAPAARVGAGNSTEVA